MTYHANKVLAVITARGGSKGLPRKNVLPLAGRPLIGWTIAAARSAQCIGRVVVSTDDDEIARIALAEGAEVPFMRPYELATDTARSIDVLRHAIEQCPGFDYVLLLQPTSPLRTSDDIDSAFSRMQTGGASACVSVCDAEISPWLMYLKSIDGKLTRILPEPSSDMRRQNLPTAYRLNGAIYMAKIDYILNKNGFIDSNTVGYLMPHDRSIDIDTAIDFSCAEKFLLNNKIIGV